MKKLISLGYLLVNRNNPRLVPPSFPEGYFTIAGCHSNAVIPSDENMQFVSSLVNAEKLATTWKISIADADTLVKFNSQHANDINYDILLTYKNIAAAMQL